jgi:hypothetical protein
MSARRIPESAKKVASSLRKLQNYSYEDQTDCAACVIAAVTPTPTRKRQRTVPARYRTNHAPTPTPTATTTTTPTDATPTNDATTNNNTNNALAKQKRQRAPEILVLDNVMSNSDKRNIIIPYDSFVEFMKSFVCVACLSNEGITFSKLTRGIATSVTSKCECGKKAAIKARIR